MLLTRMLYQIDEAGLSLATAILKGEKDYFALIGRKTTCNWVGEHSEDLPEEVEEFEDNDLDFEMM